ncbi:MAG: ABC transporter permease [candidate division Zixibacteria bacterium]|nr:ABC transporter permease [candidate division Zixibacteria bacterium]
MVFSFRTIILREIVQRKGRMISGLMAITLGIAVIVAIQSVTSVSRQVVAKKLDLLGANIMVLPQGATIDDYYTADVDAPTFPEEYVERIVTSMIPGVDNMSPKLSRRIKIDGSSVILTGILPMKELASKPIWQASGLIGAELELACAPSENKESSLTEADLKAVRKIVDSLRNDEIWVGSSIAERFNVKTGSIFPIEGQTFEVTHMLPETGTIDDNRIFAHLHVVQKLLGIEGQVSNIEIMGCCSEISDGLLGKLRNILPDTRITTIGHIVNTQLETNRLMAKVALVLLVIIILVGSFSIGNYMWANVEERRKEIGTLITIGWGRRHIYWMFFAKAVMLGLAGGILGYLVGTSAAVILGPYLAGLNIDPVLNYLWWSILVAVMIALAGSWYPIYRAARIDPAIIMQEI